MPGLKESTDATQRSELARKIVIAREVRIRRAMSDCHFWLTQMTKTKDEQCPEDPYKPFPSNKQYFQPLLTAFDNEPVYFLKKSRTMMASWLVAGWSAHKGFNNPAIGVVFQSQDEDRAVADVEKVKVLWSQSDDELKKRWPLSKSLDKQPYNRLDLENGSWFAGIPGDPNKARSLHPTIAVLDEAAFIVRGDETYNVVLATRSLHVICLSSAEKGWFEAVTESALPCDWPTYSKEK